MLCHFPCIDKIYESIGKNAIIVSACTPELWSAHLILKDVSLPIQRELADLIVSLQFLTIEPACYIRIKLLMRTKSSSWGYWVPQRILPVFLNSCRWEKYLEVQLRCHHLWASFISLTNLFRIFYLGRCQSYSYDNKNHNVYLQKY